MPDELPTLPEAISPEILRELDDARLDGVTSELEATRRTVQRAMAPFERLLKEVQARESEVATERRRRERGARHAARIAARAEAAAGERPTLASALSSEPSLLDLSQPLRGVAAILATGGEVGFGFATRPGVIAFTDGRQMRQASTVGEARDLWTEGWEPGAPNVPGVRVHLVGTRIERVVSPTEVFVDVRVDVQGGLGRD